MRMVEPICLVFKIRLVLHRQTRAGSFLSMTLLTSLRADGQRFIARDIAFEYRHNTFVLVSTSIPMVTNAGRSGIARAPMA